jgi:predicted NUDIX family NTP pyrophosphohydrolase
MSPDRPRRGQVSAGTLLYRTGAQGMEVLIARPSGPAARYGWSIPKGLPDEGESLEAAARRETDEETGVIPGELRELGHVDYQKSKKRIHCFLGPAPKDATPRKSSWEISEARFVTLDEARRLLHLDQRAFIDMLEAALKR